MSGTSTSRAWRDSKLTFLELTAFAVGNIVGLGVMSMIGIGIATTGTWLWLAVLIGGALAFLAAAPQMALNSFEPFPDGQYEQLSRLGSPLLGGIYAYLMLTLIFSIGAFARSAADVLSLPELASRLIAVCLIAALAALHAFSPKVAAIVQVAFVALLALAFASFIAFLTPHVQSGYLTENAFIGGTGSFFFACLYMAYMLNGTAALANYAGQAGNPQRDVPRAMALALGAVTLVDAALAVLDAGVLPIRQVANWDLEVAAREFMSETWLTFFLSGGSAFALLAPLNFIIGALVAPLVSAARDGWLPSALAWRSPVRGAPLPLLAAVFVAAAIPVAAGMNSAEVTNSTLLLILVTQIAVAVCALRVPVASTKAWQGLSAHMTHMSRGLDTALVVLAIVANVLVTGWLAVTMNRTFALGNAALLVLAVLTALLVRRLSGAGIGPHD